MATVAKDWTGIKRYLISDSWTTFKFILPVQMLQANIYYNSALLKEITITAPLSTHILS